LVRRQPLTPPAQAPGWSLSHPIGGKTLQRPSSLAGPLLAALSLAALLAVPAAHAANARVAISDFQWSKPEIPLDLDEHVTWYWTGPDLQHSVTQTSGPVGGIDSDPGNPTPTHAAGDLWAHTFDEAGTYEFRCKLHSVVRGTVVVSNEPGDPVTEPDPIPQVNFDAKAPKLTDVRLQQTTFGKSGTTLYLTLNEKATIDAEFWRRTKDGHLKYAGWQEWPGHIGYNSHEGFGVRGEHLRPRSGRYVAEIRATDSNDNRTRTKLRFRIR
jgi:plastocyanin